MKVTAILSTVTMVTTAVTMVTKKRLYRLVSLFYNFIYSKINITEESLTHGSLR